MAATLKCDTIQNASSATANITLNADGTTTIGSGTITTTANTTLSGGTAREAISADRTYYVSTTGSNSNTGLSAGSPFATIQKAVDVATALDSKTYNITIQLADGTYNQSVVLTKGLLGSGSLTINGNATTPANVVVNNSSGDTFNLTESVNIVITNLKITSSAVGIRANYSSYLRIGNLNFGACGPAHMISSYGSTIIAQSAYAISGGAWWHISTSANGYYEAYNFTITLTGTPAFSQYFAYASALGSITATSLTFSGAATGTRYSVITNSVINTGGAGASYFPGNAAGSAATGGQYL